MSFAEDNAKAWSEITELHHSRPEEFGTIETANGPGATLAQTEALREILPMVFKRYGVKSVLDVGCGDWNWMSQVDLGDLNVYIGWDVEASMIRENQEKYGDEHVRFFDTSLLTCETMPSVDLILARHVLIHFPNDEIVKVLDKMRASGAKYLLTSHWPDGSNEDYEPEGFAWRGYMERALNMQAPPFNVAPLLETIHEPAADAGVLMAAHELALFELIPQPGLAEFDLPDKPAPWEPQLFTDPGVQQVTTPGVAIVSPEEFIEMKARQEHCRHTSTYRVHRADDTVATVCTDCQMELDSKREAGGMFSFHDTIARWAADVEQGGLGASGKEARLQGRPVTRKELLRGLKENHREVVEMARKDDSLESAWLLLGAQAAVIDAVLDELLGERDV
jgi:SAM-dependent methyltransferase